MRNLNKKGMSSIIQISLLTMLSVMAISMVLGYVLELSDGLGSRLSPTVDCIQQESEITNACINAEGKVEINLEVALDESINKVNLLLNQESFSCGGDSCQSCIISENENRKTIYINPTNLAQSSDQLIVSINGCQAQPKQLGNC